MFVQIYINMNTNMKKWNLRKDLFCPLFYVYYMRFTLLSFP